MSFKILENINYGKGSLTYRLKAGDIVREDLFEPKDLPRLFRLKAIGLSESNEISAVKPSKIKEIPDISEMSANDIRDMIEGINDQVVILKMIDKESLIQPPRKNVLPILNKRSKEISTKA